jgi:hypothetical protein
MHALTFPVATLQSTLYPGLRNIYICVYVALPPIPLEIITLANIMILHVLDGVLWGEQQTQKGVLHKQLHGILAI